MTMADRIAILEDGQLRQVGTPREVYDRPADLFVAGFIGTPPMNTVPGTVSDGTAQVGASTLPVAVPDGRERVVVGIRPEHLRLDAAGPLRATVRQAEWLGHEALLRVQLAGVEGQGTSWMVRLVNEDAPPDPGSEVRLAPTGPVHLFDADTGRRLEAGGSQ